MTSFIHTAFQFIKHFISVLIDTSNKNGSYSFLSLLGNRGLQGETVHSE